MGFREVREHLSKFSVGIGGAGGLGSNCAVALARSCVGRLVICDFDYVETSNLNRQYFFYDQVGIPKVAALKANIGRINSGTRIITCNEKLDRNNIEKIFRCCDVIVEALDSADMKELFIETVQTRLPGVPVVAGSGLAGWGATGNLRMRKIDDSLYVCGDESSEDSAGTPVMAPRVGIVANMQANTVIEILMNMKKD
jgi:sulfur carrier protein ThiS adenylyltransferase